MQNPLPQKRMNYNTQSPKQETRHEPASISQTDPDALSPLADEIRRPGRRAHHGRRPRRRPGRGLRAQTQLLRSRRSTSNSPTPSSASASNIPKPAASSYAPGKTTYSVPAPTSACSAQSTHAHKVNFCKFTNETRMAIEDASESSGQIYLCADQRHRRRWRLRARRHRRPHHADRRPPLHRIAPRNAPARRPPRHRRPHPPDRQAPRPPRPRRRLLLHGGRRSRQARRRMAPGRRSRPPLRLGPGRSPLRAARTRRPLRPTGSRARHHPQPPSPAVSQANRITYSHVQR